MILPWSSACAVSVARVLYVSKRQNRRRPGNRLVRPPHKNRVTLIDTPGMAGGAYRRILAAGLFRIVRIEPLLLSCGCGVRDINARSRQIVYQARGPGRHRDALGCQTLHAYRTLL